MKTTRIEMTDGYIELREEVTRKMSREYMATLDEYATVNADGDKKITTKGVDVASENLVRDMIERVVAKGEDGVEREVEVTREWMDELPESVYSKVQDYVLKKFNGAREKAKK